MMTKHVWKSQGPSYYERKRRGPLPAKYQTIGKPTLSKILREKAIKATLKKTFWQYISMWWNGR